MIERGNQLADSEEKKALVDTLSTEFKELSFNFITLFNEPIQKNQVETKITEVEKAYSLKNQHIALNFEKREMDEVSFLAWFNSSESNDEKKLQDLIYRYKSKGQEKIPIDVMCSPYASSSDFEIHDVIICKIILGESLVVFEEEGEKDKEKEKEKEAEYDKYDTIVKLFKEKTKRVYQVRRLENIQLLYLIKIKDRGILEPQVIKCGNDECTENLEKDPTLTTSIINCVLRDMYLCTDCHIKFHIESDKSKCLTKIIMNLPGKCDNVQAHPPTTSANPDKHDIDFFCLECNKGICSFCRFYGSEKHKNIKVITTLFKACKDDNTKMQTPKSLNESAKDLNKSKGIISDHSSNLRFKVTEAYKSLYYEIERKVVKSGEKQVKICYELNFMKDLLKITNENYKLREAFLDDFQLYQDLLWTKKIHLQNILYLIKVKKQIETKFLFDRESFEKYTAEKYEEIEQEISNSIGEYNSKLTLKDVKNELYKIFQ